MKKHPRIPKLVIGSNQALMALVNRSPRHLEDPLPEVSIRSAESVADKLGLDHTAQTALTERVTGWMAADSYAHMRKAMIQDLRGMFPSDPRRRQAVLRRAVKLWTITRGDAIHRPHNRMYKALGGALPRAKKPGAGGVYARTGRIGAGAPRKPVAPGAAVGGRKAAAVGEIREWRGKKYQKKGPGQWAPVGGPAKAGKPEPEAPAKKRPKLTIKRSPEAQARMEAKLKQHEAEMAAAKKKLAEEGKKKGKFEIKRSPEAQARMETKAKEFEAETAAKRKEAAKAPQKGAEQLKAAISQMVQQHGKKAVADALSSIHGEVAEHVDHAFSAAAGGLGSEPAVKKVVSKKAGKDVHNWQSPEKVKEMAGHLGEDPQVRLLAEREVKKAMPDVIDAAAGAVASATDSEHPEHDEASEKKTRIKSIASKILKSGSGSLSIGFINKFLHYLAGSGIDDAAAARGFSASATSKLGNVASDEAGKSGKSLIDRLIAKFGGEGKGEKKEAQDTEVAGVYAGALAGMVPMMFGSGLSKSIDELTGEQLIKSFFVDNPVDGVDNMESVLLGDLIKAGPFIGPRGGKWADPQHKIPWKESAPKRSKKEKPEKKKPKYQLQWFHGTKGSIEEQIKRYGSRYLTDDYDFADGYGQVYVLTLKPDLKVFDTADENQMKQVVSKLLKDNKEGKLPPDLEDIVEHHESDADALADDLSPTEIREESVYDSGVLQGWLWDTFEFQLVTFEDRDTALLLDAAGGLKGHRKAKEDDELTKSIKDDDLPAYLMDALCKEVEHQVCDQLQKSNVRDRALFTINASKVRQSVMGMLLKSMTSDPYMARAVGATPIEDKTIDGLTKAFVEMHAAKLSESTDVLVLDSVVVEPSNLDSILLGDLVKGAGPFIGPRGGKWADPKHTIPWKESVSKKPKGDVSGNPLLRKDPIHLGRPDVTSESARKLWQRITSKPGRHIYEIESGKPTIRYTFDVERGMVEQRVHYLDKGKWLLVPIKKLEEARIVDARHMFYALQGGYAGPRTKLKRYKEEGKGLQKALGPYIGHELNRSMIFDLIKGAGHKYVKRSPTGKPKPKYRYYYRVPGRKGLVASDDVKKGAKLKMTHEGKEGHFEIKGKHKETGKVKLKHDESGKTIHVHESDLKRMVQSHHLKQGAKTVQVDREGKPVKEGIPKLKLQEKKKREERKKLGNLKKRAKAIGMELTVSGDEYKLGAKGGGRTYKTLDDVRDVIEGREAAGKVSVVQEAAPKEPGEKIPKLKIKPAAKQIPSEDEKLVSMTEDEIGKVEKLQTTVSSFAALKPDETKTLKKQLHMARTKANELNIPINAIKWDLGPKWTVDWDKVPDARPAKKAYNRINKPRIKPGKPEAKITTKTGLAQRPKGVSIVPSRRKPTVTMPAKKATDKQIRYAWSMIRKLKNEDYGTYTTYGYQRITRNKLGNMSSSRISSMIDHLKSELY